MNEATIKLSRNLPGIAQGLDDVISDVAGGRIGFALVVFTEGRASYVSNCGRSEVVRELRNLLERGERVVLKAKSPLESKDRIFKCLLAEAGESETKRSRDEYLRLDAVAHPCWAEPEAFERTNE